MIFDYPGERTQRCHGSSGYSSYESFRPWLRDEFMFRCVYCLKRETWGQMTGEFELDHFEPQSLSPNRRRDYFNLVYACRRCNAVKLTQSVSDPLTILNSTNVAVLPDGELSSQDVEVLRLVRQLDLNAPQLLRWRTMWLRIVQLAENKDRALHRQIVGFPDDLPDLSRLRPPKNSRPDGIESCWLAKRQHGWLPDAY